jgi:membrane-bound lytic murein transglycosylase D
LEAGNQSPNPSAASDLQLQAAIDSTSAEESDWLLDSLTVMVDSLTVSEDIVIEVPDISDSLAALTEAQLPSTDEIFDYPVVVNRRVLTWVDYFVGKIHKNFDRGLRRSGRYLAMARRIFAEEGVPQDLVFLAHVESAFQVNALSHARALGLWQFMRGTGKLYGLRCDAYVDERLDPEKATRAAARLLRDLYAHYNDWYLALAAYNAGAGNVDRAIQRAGTRDFWQLAQTRHLRHETRNFVPAILAATIVAKSPGAYGLTEETDPALTYDTVVVDSPIDLRVVARYVGASVSELERLNPALLLNQSPPLAQKYEIHVPLGLGDHFARRLAEIPAEERLVYQRHKVKSGENLALVARKYGTTVRAVQDANHLGRSTLIRAGQSLLIPGRHSVGRSTRDEEDVAWNGKTAVTHRVRRGETLSRIASLYGISTKAVQSANKLANPNQLRVGQELVIPVAGKASEPQETSPRAEAAAEALALAKIEIPPTRSMMAQNNSEALGRVASTAHIVEQARLAIGSEPETEDAPDVAVKGAAAKDSRVTAAPEKPASYRVQRGDTLAKIGRRFGVSVDQLRRWNGMRSGNLIYPGQRIAVSSAAAQGAEASVSSGSSSGSAEPARIHVVRRGDSLWKIAQRYKVSANDLMRWNGLSRSSVLHPGQKLKLR